MNHVLLISAHPETGTELAEILSQNGFQVSSLEHSEAAHESVTDDQYDLIIVNPDLSGWVVKNITKAESTVTPTGTVQGTGIIRELRSFHVTLPIFVYTGIEAELDETAALDAGADGVIFKTASASLILARLNAHLRRRTWNLRLEQRTEGRIYIGRYPLDVRSRLLLVDKRAISLTARQIRLLEILASSSTQLVSEVTLLDGIWGEHPRRSIQALTHLRSTLRGKFEQVGLSDPVENFRGRGFRLSPSIQ